MKPSLWGRFRTTYRQLGFARTMTYTADRLLRALSPAYGLYLYQFVAQPLADRPRLPPTRGKAFSFRLLDAPEPLLDALGRPAAVIAQRFAQGTRCLAALKEERLVGCIWFARKHFMEDEVRIDYQLPPDGSCVWDFDVFVTESERAGFLFPKLWDAFDGQLKADGVILTLSRINSLNQHSLASHRRLGASDCGWAMILRLKSFELMVSDLAPYLTAGTRKRQPLQIAPRRHP